MESPFLLHPQLRESLSQASYDPVPVIRLDLERHRVENDMNICLGVQSQEAVDRVGVAWTARIRLGCRGKVAVCFSHLPFRSGLRVATLTLQIPQLPLGHTRSFQLSSFRTFHSFPETWLGNSQISAPASPALLARLPEDHLQAQIFSHLGRAAASALQSGSR